MYPTINTITPSEREHFQEQLSLYKNQLYCFVYMYIACITMRIVEESICYLKKLVSQDNFKKQLRVVSELKHVI